MRAYTNTPTRPANGVTIDDLLLMLGKVRKSGKGWLACCPAHDDSNASMQVSEGDKGIMLKCWAGCLFSEIVDSLGLRAGDLFYDALSGDKAREYRKLGIQKQITRLKTVTALAETGKPDRPLTEADKDYYRQSVVKLIELRNERDEL